MAFYDDIPECREADESESGLHFHYKREERIKNAPKIVQDYYAGKMAPTKGLFKVLVATKFNRFMLLTMALCFMVAFFVKTFSNRPSLATAAGFELELEAFSYDEIVYAQVKVHPLKKSLKDKNFAIDKFVEDKEKVLVDFSFTDADGAKSAKIQKSAEIEKNAFFIRTNSPDYDIIEVAAQVNLLGESATLVSKVKRRE